MATPILFLDDASRHTGVADRMSAQTLARTLLETLKALRRVNRRFALNSAGPIAHYEVAQGWSLQMLLQSSDDKDNWLFIRMLNDRSPLDAMMNDALVNQAESMDCRTKVANLPSVALAWAALTDSATVSCDTHADWSQAWVDVILTRLAEDGSLTDFHSKVRNSSNPQHVEAHLDWLKLLGVTKQPSAIQIWEEQIDRYPGLRFLRRTKKDLAMLELSGAPFPQALSCLAALQHSVDKWDVSSAWPELSNADPEASQRRQYCFVNDEVTGESECFDWHARFTGGIEGRIHFRVDEASRQIIIGYMGGKLFGNIPR